MFILSKFEITARNIKFSCEEKVRREDKVGISWKSDMIVVNRKPISSYIPSYVIYAFLKIVFASLSKQ